jgi:hypothetical protein
MSNIKKLPPVQQKKNPQRKPGAGGSHLCRVSVISAVIQAEIQNRRIMVQAALGKK